jgi:hypothetical protein
VRDTDGRFVTIGHGDHISVSRWPGIALWYVRGCEDDMECAIVRMVGDDLYHHVDRSEITPIDRESFCGNCGQIGCAHG